MRGGLGDEGGDLARRRKSPGLGPVQRRAIGGAGRRLAG